MEPTFGTVIERLAYEPFGKRRFATGSDDPNNTIVPQNTDRGYTNHEHLDELTLVHMNGRVYDPVVGRFMSADPQIQDPMNLQSYNRYAYVMNNPLMYTDPSGYFSWKKIFKVAVVVAAIVVAPQIAAAAFQSSYVALATGATVAQAGTAFTAANIIGGAAAGAFVGATIGAVTGGTLQSTIQGAGYGAISGGIGGGISGYFGDTWSPSRVVANGLGSGISSEIKGGSFRDGIRTGFALSGLTYLAVSMRTAMLAQSQLSPGNLNENGDLGGGRIVQEKLDALKKNLVAMFKQHLINIFLLLKAVH